MELKGNRTVNLLADQAGPGDIWYHIGTTEACVREVLEGLARMLKDDGKKVGYYDAGAEKRVRNIPQGTLLDDIDQVDGLDVLIVEPDFYDAEAEIWPPKHEIGEHFPKLRDVLLIVGHLEQDTMNGEVPAAVFDANLISWACHGEPDAITIRGFKGVGLTS